MKIMRHLSQQPQPQRDEDEHVITAATNRNLEGDWKQLSPRDHPSNVFRVQCSLLDSTKATHISAWPPGLPATDSLQAHIFWLIHFKKLASCTTL